MSLNDFQPRLPVLGRLALIALVGFVVLSLPTRMSPSQDRVDIPLQVAFLDVTSMDYNTAARLLETAFSDLFDHPLPLQVEDQTAWTSASELGFSLDVFKTIERVDRAGKEFQDSATLMARLFGPFESLNLSPVIHLDQMHLSDTLVRLFPALEGRSEVTVSLYGFTSTLHLETAEPSDEATLEEPSPPSSPDELHWSQISIPEPFKFTYQDGAQDYIYTMRPTREWLDLNAPDDNGVYQTLQQDKILSTIEKKIAPDFYMAHADAVLKALPAEGSDYATVEGIVQDGRALNVEATFDAYRAARDAGEKISTLVVEEVAGQIINETGQDLPDLTLLGYGRSNFETSPSGRDFNVRKGLNEKVNNIWVAVDAEYDFNKNLGPITHSAGWQNSLAIFGGSNLVSVPGGGLCQVSTTVYRAALWAGLPITQQYSHSLYVHYYTEGGDGLDSTIYPGGKNLKFKNDTGYPILIQAYDEGYDAYARVYGVSDGRSVEMIGPFYPKSIPAEYQSKISLRSNQIGWIRVIRDANGAVRSEDNRVGTYRSIPY